MEKDLLEKLTPLLARADHLIEAATKIGVAYVGFRAGEKIAKGGGVGGALSNLIALKLAQSGNIVAGAAGVATLAGTGLTSIGALDLISEVSEDIDWNYYLYGGTSL